MITICLQIWRTHDGQRPITYALYFNQTFIGYSRCWCAANKAAEWLTLTLEMSLQAKTYEAAKERAGRYAERRR